MDDWKKSFSPENRGVSQELFDEIIKTNLDCRFFNDMAIYVSALGHGSSELKCQIHEGHINPRGIAHGAVYFAILDTAMGMAIRTLNSNCVTIQFASSFIRSAKKGDILTGKATIDHSGKKIFFARGELFDQDGNLILTATGSFYNKGTFLNK